MSAEVPRPSRVEVLVPLLAWAAASAAALSAWAQRLTYPYDLEWLEGGVLAHAWRLSHGLPLYVRPSPEFVPFDYPPGYPALLAALAPVLGLSPPVGRLLSAIGSLAAAGSAAFLVRRRGGSGLAAGLAGAVFLGAWADLGASFDLVRPDGVMLGLLGWAIALGVDRARGSEVAAGLLLAAAAVMKPVALVFVLPLLPVLVARSRGAALRFLGSAAPVAGLAAWWQWRSEGLFWTWLVEVPAAHALLPNRVWPGWPRELGTALPLPLGLLTGVVLFDALRGQRSLPAWGVAGATVAAGTLTAWSGTYWPPPNGSGLYNAPSSVAFFALGAVPVALIALGVGRALDRRAGRADLPTTPLRTAVPFALVAVGSSALMRAHDAGYVDVHAPLVWTVAVASALVFDRVWAASGAMVRRGLALGATLQALWVLGTLDRGSLVPTPADVALGARMVDACRSVDGPVLSPFAVWIPVMAGKEPSLHRQGLWALEASRAPWRGDLATIEQAIRERRWALVLGGNEKFGFGLNEAYTPGPRMVSDRDPALMPKTGFDGRPIRTMRPTP